MRKRCAVGLCLLLAAWGGWTRADVWDATGDNAQATTRNELVHGADQVHDLAAQPGPAADADWFRIRQQRYSSYEILVDATGGDLGTSGPTLDLVASDGTTLLSSLAAGAGSSRSLRFENATAGVVDNQRVRVVSPSCGTNCGSEDTYRIRVLETTGTISRFNNSGTQITVVVLQNTGASTLSGHLNFWSGTGASLMTPPFVIAGHGSLVVNTSGLVPGSNGTLTVSNNGTYGQLVGRATAIEPATGFTFDTALEPRPMPNQGAGGGRGGAALALNPTSGDYGSVFVGGSKPITFTVRNLGAVASGALALGLGGPDAAQFSISNDTCTGVSLGAGGVCSAQVSLAPSSGGPKSAVLTVGSPAGSFTASLAGTGINGNPVFVTSTPVNGGIGGLAPADALCQARAAAGGLPPGTYVAWLSTTTVDAVTRLGTSRGYIRTDGQPFADTQTALLANRAVLNPIATDEFGNASGFNDVWTGTLSTGTGGANNCADWGSSSNLVSGTAGHTRGGPTSWTQLSFPTCDTPLPIYCFRTDLNVTVTPPPVPDRLAFVTNGTFTINPALGIQAADDFCGVEACGGLPCPVKAYLALNGAKAASRFTLTNYARFDEVPVGGAAELDGAGPLKSGIWQHQGGLYISGTILSTRATWTGAALANLPGDATTTCNNWTDPGGTVWIGDPTLANTQWFGRASGQSCSTPRRLYCLFD